MTEQKSFYISKSVSISDRYNFYEYLSVMVDSGVSISDALSSVQAKMKNEYFKEKVQELMTYIDSGDSFSKAMKKTPQVFPTNEVHIIESGEVSGGLVDSLGKLSDDLQKIQALKAKVKGALTYPIIIFFFLISAILIVLTYVIPSIIPLFETADVALPASTQALIATSDFIRNKFYIIFFLFFAVFVFLMGYRTTEEGRKRIDAFVLRIPLMGMVYKNYILAQIAGNLGSLLGSGVNVLKALTLTGKSVNNSIYTSILQSVVNSVARGNKIVDSIEEVDEENIYFPADFLQMLSVGEKTANLEKITKKISDQYDREVDYSLANMTKWIEPIAIILAAGFVCWFAFAIFGAILKVTQTV